jgi:CHAT domain-containing protein
VQKLLDFDVVIERDGDGYRTRVLASPAGQAQASFLPPFTEKDLEILILRVSGSIGRARRQVRRIETQERRQLEEFGGQLFQALFSGPVAECLGRSRIAAESRGAGLRIRLRLPGALANIPWEYLHDAEYGFLGMSPETALVRYVDMPIPARPFPVSPPLRILAMISAPDDVPGLEADQEWSKLRESLGDLIDRGMVEVDRLETGTLAALQRPLRLHKYHVLHFVGHGVYDEDAEDGALALEGPDGKHRLVTGRDLGVLIRGHRSLRLVVLNACEGARSARDDPFGGVAQALVRQGIPAVIAMQFEISDPAAVVFSQSFYQAIADREPVDMAMVEARIAMFAEGNEVEWATPVLYLRSPDGRIFTRGRISQDAIQAREKAGQQAREKAGQQAREKAGQQAREKAGQQARQEAEARFPDVAHMPAHRISMIGPSGAGKTTLAAVLLDEMRRDPPDSSIRLRAADLATENWIAKQTEGLYASAADGNVDPNRIQATTEPFTLSLGLELGIEPPAISIELLDAPFNMLTSSAQPGMSQQVLDDCREFVAESAILLLPIDAGPLMEAAQHRHRRALPGLLDLAHVEQVVRDWAAERNRLVNQPSLVAFCPVKCESYFADNGGTRDMSVQLLSIFHEVYQDVVRAIQGEAPETSLLYIAVDTIGYVEIMDADWITNEGTGEIQFRPRYLARPPYTTSRVGVHDLAKALCRIVIGAERMLAAEHLYELEARTAQARNFAERSEGIFRDAWLWAAGERASRAQIARAAEDICQQVLHRVSKLDEILQQLFTTDGPRVIHL